jgi:cyanophycin synthetase
VHDTWGGDPVAAVTLSWDRRDDLVTETAASIAAWFGRVAVYEDVDLRGRRPVPRPGPAALREARPGLGTAMPLALPHVPAVQTVSR